MGAFIRYTNFWWTEMLINKMYLLRLGIAMRFSRLWREGLASFLVLALAASTAHAQVFPRAANLLPRFSNSDRCVVRRASAWCGAEQFCSFVGTQRSIFNGRDLSGWTNVEGKEPGEGWKVENGVICREKDAGDLYLQGKYENFILEFKFKISEKGNSGVKYRSWNTEGWGMGCEYQIYDDVGDAKNPPRYQTGALYDVVAPREGSSKIKMGEFNSGKIIVLGNHIEHYLNGELVVSIDVGTPEWNVAKNESKFKDVPEFGATTIGRIFLQDHNCKVWFKDLYLTELKPVDCGLVGFCRR